MSGHSGVLESLHVLDTSLDPMLWTQPALTGESPGARHGHAALNVRGEVYTIGGFGDDGYSDSLNLLQLLPDSAPAAPPAPPLGCVVNATDAGEPTATEKLPESTVNDAPPELVAVSL